MESYDNNNDNSRQQWPRCHPRRGPGFFGGGYYRSSSRLSKNNSTAGELFDNSGLIILTNELLHREVIEQHPPTNYCQTAMLFGAATNSGK